MSRATTLLALAAYLVLAGRWVVRTPVFEAPDELAHATFVQRIADGAPLPIVRGSNERAGRPPFHQHTLAHHPPLYYLVLGSAVRVLAPDGVRPTPVWSSPQIDGPQNRLLHRHGHDEVSPVSPEVWRFRALRGASVILGLALLLVTVRLAAVLAPGRPQVAASSALILAVLPTFSIAHAALDNGNLATLLATAVLLLLVVAVRDRRLGLGRTFALAVLLGAALNTKLTVVYLPGLFVAGAWFLWRAGSRAAALRTVLAALLGILCLVPFVLRNLALYGEPLAVRAHEAAFANNRLGDDVRLTYVLELLPLETLRSLVAGVGWDRSQPASILFGLFAALALGALLGPVLSRGGDSRPAGRGRGELLALLVLAILGTVAIYVRFNLVFRQPQGRYLLSALPPAAILLALGLERWRGRGPRFAGGAVLLAALIAGVLYQDERVGARFRFDASSADRYRSNLTAGLRSESGVPLGGVRPLDAAWTEDGTPVLRWEQSAPRDRPLSLHVHVPGAALVAGTYEARGEDVSDTDGSDTIRELALPEELWRAVPPGGALRWKLREVPDRARGETAADAPESRWQLVRRP